MSRSTSAFPTGSRVPRWIAAIAIAAIALVAVPMTAMGAIPNFVFSGAGYGHGIGLSQYGAKGYAERGMSGTWIVNHYYPGTTITKPAARTVRVNLDPAANYTTSSSTYNAGYNTASWKIRAGWAGLGVSLNNGAPLPDAAGPFTLKPLSANRIAVTDKDGHAVKGSPFSGTLKVDMTGTAPVKLLQVVGRSGPFKTSSVTPSTDVRYRGVLLVRSNGSKVKLLNELPMDSYLYGVVPRESPASWHMEALKAQAIVARSYAYVRDAELYCDTRSQMYNGYSHDTRDTTASKMHENSRTNSAVHSTAGRCVSYEGAVVATYFSSSSGGYTANKVHIWGGTEIPYLKGVPDPYGAGSFDPWKTPVTLNGMELAEKLAPHITGEPAGAGSTVYVESLVIDHTWPDGFAGLVKVTWSDSTTSSTSGEQWRQWLGLRSNKFFANAWGSRIGAAGRSSRSVAASKVAFPTASGSKRVIVVNANGSLYVEAILAASLSGVAQAPVLFINKTSVPAEVTAEIKRLHPSKIYIIGGTPVVSSAVYSTLRGLVPSIERIRGADRYATSAAVAREAHSLGASSAGVVVASGTSWVDASVAAAIAGGSKRPLLLTSPTRLSGATSSVLKEFKTTKSCVVGNSSTMSDATVKSITAITHEKSPTVRVGTTGTSYDLGVAAATYEVESLGFSRAAVYAPSAGSMSDVLIASALAAATKHPFVLSGTYTPPAATRAFLTANHAFVKGVTVVGAPEASGLAVGMRLMSDAY